MAMGNAYKVRLAALGGLVLAASVLWAPPASAGGSTTRYVDDDGHAGGAAGCDGAKRAHKRLQPTVEASGTGDLILVCPGIYREELLVRGSRRNGLRIRAAQPWQAIVIAPGGDGTMWSLLRIEDASGVVVQGLELRAPTGGSCRYVSTMIYLAPGTSDVLLRGNRIRPSGSDSLGRCGYGGGIHVFSGPHWIGDNVIRDFKFNGISVGTGGVEGYPGRATVVRNRIHFHHAGIASSWLGGSGIYFGSGRATFVHNVIDGLPSAGEVGAAGTALLDTGISGGDFDSSLVIRANVVRHVQHGIDTGYGDVKVIDNVVRHSRATGILERYGSGIIRGNRVFDSGGNGIEVTDSGVVVRGNTALRSGQFDCADRSAIKNTWVDNIGETSDPAGLCTPPA
jgi:hypothetical protein